MNDRPMQCQRARRTPAPVPMDRAAQRAVAQRQFEILDIHSCLSLAVACGLGFGLAVGDYLQPVPDAGHCQLWQARYE